MVIVDEQSWQKNETDGPPDESKISQDDQLDLFYRYLNRIEDDGASQARYTEAIQRPQAMIESDDEEVNRIKSVRDNQLRI